MKKEKSSCRKRLFLNSDKTQLAAIKFYIDYELSIYRNDSANQSLDAELSISDCNRIVNLDFMAYNKKDLDGRIKKAERLRDTIILFTEEFIKKAELFKCRVDEINKHNKEIKASKKKKGDKDLVVEHFNEISKKEK